jgi:hypothetical protein
MLVQGRARVAILVSGACLLGGTAGLLQPALAASKPASATFDSAEPDVYGAAPADEFDSSEPVPVAPTDVKENIRPVETQAGGGFDSTEPKEPAPAAPAEDGDEADSDDTEKSKSPERSENTPRESTATPSDERGPVLASHASYAALPASWTSLAPLSLPTFGVDGFPIPPFLLPIYQAAAAQYGVPWEVLASINEIETNFGRNAGISSAGAMGWMQFIYSSWERWGTDSDGDRRRDPRNPVDAIFAAARYLRDAGAHTDLPKAIFAYNHAGWYVNKVVERAREFAGLDATLVAALSERALREDGALYRAAGNPFAGEGAIRPNAGQALLLSKRQLTRMVLDSPGIKIYEGGRQDIAAGHIDRRVLAALLFLERSNLKPTVTSLFRGHSRLTTSGNVSAHSYGHAVDIAAINGISINGNQGAGSITATALDKLVQLQGYLRPNQIISLMTVDGRDNTIAMGDHADHIHLGFPRVPRVPDAGRPKDINRLVAALRARTNKP